MKKFQLLMLVVLVVSAFALAACSGGSSSQSSGGNAPVNAEPPAPYKDMKNPHAGDQASADAGKTLFEQNCATCHGQEGKGDGEAGKALTPAPANLTLLDAKVNSDGFLMWRISEGGSMAPYNSSMPAFKDTLSEDQRWQVITFLRSISK